jgi:hypothetical protein
MRLSTFSSFIDLVMVSSACSSSTSRPFTTSSP